MKLTKDQAIEALRLAGVTAAEIVENEADSEYNGDEVLEQVDASREVVLKPKIRTEMRDQVYTEQAGRLGKETERLLRKATGIVKFKDGLSDAEKWQEAIEFVKANNDKKGEDTNKLLQEVSEAHKAELDKLTNEFGEKLTASERRLVEKELTEYYEGLVNEMPILETANKKQIATLARQHMENLYHVKYDDNGKKIGYYQKDNNDLPALNAAKNNPLDDKEEVKTFLSSLGVYKTDMRHNNPNDVNNRTVSVSMPGNVANDKVKDNGEGFMESVKNYTKQQLAGGQPVKI